MGTITDYKRSWGAYRERVKGIYSEFSDAEKELESYRGSAYGDEQHAKNKEQYDTAMAAARAAFSDEVNGILQTMMANIDIRESAATPPSDAQLRLLQTAQLMSDMDLTTYGKIATAMEHNDIALRALHDLAAERMPGVKLPEFKSEADAARAQVRELTRGAQDLIGWDGGTSNGDALRDYLADDKQNGRFRGLPSSESRMYNAASAAILDPTSPGFIQDVVGMRFDEHALGMVEE